MAQCKKLNEAVGAGRGTKSCWDTVSLLKKDLSKDPANERLMKREYGKICTTPEENSEVFRHHFESLYNHEASFDPSALDLLQQREQVGCVDMPSEEEIDKAIRKLNNIKPGISGLSSELFSSCNVILGHGASTRGVGERTFVSPLQKG